MPTSEMHPSPLFVVSADENFSVVLRAAAESLGQAPLVLSNLCTTARAVADHPDGVYLVDSELFRNEAALPAIGRCWPAKTIAFPVYESGPVINLLSATSELNHVVARPQRQLPWTFSSVLRKLALSHRSDIGDYLDGETEIVRRTVHCDDECQPILEEIMHLARDGRRHGDLAQSAAMAAWELIMNAVRDAREEASSSGQDVRRDQDGGRSNLDISVEFGRTSRALALSVGDKFGSLTRGALVSALQRCLLAAPAAQVKSTGGRAGIGLYMVFNTCHHFEVDVAPGRWTKVILVFDLEAHRRHFDEVRSFHFFSS